MAGVRGAAVTLVCALAGCAATPPPPTALDQQPPKLVSAFFGLDDSLPARSVAICPEAPGKDGMPVTFSRRTTIRAAIVTAQKKASSTAAMTNSGTDVITFRTRGKIASAEPEPAGWRRR